MTANAFAEDKGRCFAAGMNDFLSKPVNPGIMYEVLLKHLRQGRAPKV
jgi:CheY-like chemotaxis protein